jgi:hypothetical protein
MGKKTTSYFIIGTFVTLYLLVSVISTIHVIDFFKLSNPNWLAISLALAFEVGAAASLASIITLDKMNKGIVWGLFLILTLMQAMGNTYYAYTHLNNFQGWIELFGLTEEDLIYQKRVLSLVSGAILPVVALGFIKSLVDYIKPSDDSIASEKNIETLEEKIEMIEDSIEALDEKVEDVVDGGDSQEIEFISGLDSYEDTSEIASDSIVGSEPVTEVDPITLAEPVGESVESLNIGRYNTSVEIDPTKIN